jgi:hypothetical protein
MAGRAIHRNQIAAEDAVPMTCRINRLLFVYRLRASLAVLLVSGCATFVDVGKPDTALFARTPGSTDPGPSPHVAVIDNAALTEFKYEWTKGSPRLLIPIGQIVEAAAVAALTDEFGLPVAQYPSAEAATLEKGPVALVAMVTLQPVKFEVHDESFPLWIPLFPVVLPVATRQDVRLVVEWQVLDAKGSLLWTRRYDSGDVKMTPMPESRGRSAHSGAEKEPRFYVRLAHQAAYTLMREAARDMRNWVEAERLRERVL